MVLGEGEEVLDSTLSSLVQEMDQEVAGAAQQVARAYGGEVSYEQERIVVQQARVLGVEAGPQIQLAPSRGVQVVPTMHSQVLEVEGARALVCVSEEEAEYDLPNIDGANQEMDGGKLAAANRRSYWLSKGVVTGADDSGDD